MKEKIVTKDELWLEFGKAIDHGHFRQFTTRRGFEGHLKRMIKKSTGKEISFLFDAGYHKITKCVLKLDKEDLK